MDLIGTGIYPLHQAARLVGVEPRALRRWLQGYWRKYKGERVRSEPLWKTQLKDEDLSNMARSVQFAGSRSGNEKISF